MKKISQTIWKRFKESAGGKEIIIQFETLNEKTSAESVIAFAKLYSPQFFLNKGENEIEVMYKIYDIFSSDIEALKNNGITISSQKEFDTLFYSLIANYAGADNSEELKTMSDSCFKPILSDIMLLSLALFCHYPEYCVPNLFPLQFAYILGIAEKYELNLPEIPKTDRYWQRCMYYLDVNNALMDFAHENGIESNAEFGAFLYGYEAPKISLTLKDL